jgi:hypothetical protein
VLSGTVSLSQVVSHKAVWAARIAFLSCMKAKDQPLVTLSLTLESIKPA